MSDSGYQDPFEDEDRAQERERRRAERESKRRGKEEGTRRSLADRVREQLGGGKPDPDPEPVADAPESAPEPAPEAEPMPAPDPPAAELPAPGPSPELSTSDQPVEPPAASQGADPPTASQSGESVPPAETVEPAPPAEPEPPQEPEWTSDFAALSTPTRGETGEHDPQGEPETADHPQSSPGGFWAGDDDFFEEPRSSTDSQAVVPPPVDAHADSPHPSEWAAPGERLAKKRRSTVRRRRFAGLLALLALIAIVGAGAYAYSNRGDDAPAPVAPVKPRKTMDVTIPEGYTREQMAAVAKKAGLKGDYMKASIKSKDLNLAKYGAKDAKNLEGFLFPATYELFKNATAQDLVDKQVAAFKQNFDPINLSYSKSKNLTPYDLTIIASMIEREIQVPKERKLASSVIYNRLKDGTPLGIDATIRYEDDNFTKPLLASRLSEDTPYNTRTNTGLPPGPIGNPGADSLEAAANPAKTDYFYYVVNPDSCGASTFVKTQAEFDAAQAKYNAAREANGGKAPSSC